ncbi:sulfotransferase [Planctomycetota bacterium]
MIKVIVIHSLSFTGTTWLNVLLGCHERAFALGPPDRVMNLRDQKRDDACRVHGKDCAFWSVFFRDYDKRKSFFMQLAQAADKDVIVINNPIHKGLAEKQLNSPDIIIKDIYIVRDGRAVCASYCRHQQGSDFYDVVKNWFRPSAENFPFASDNPDIMTVRYEDVVKDQQGFINDAGLFVGLEYPQNYYKFWEFDHHITAGNSGFIAMIRRFQADKVIGINNKEFYESECRKLKKQPEKAMLDERWKNELGERELFIFDYFCGRVNESWGYTRDCFNASQIEDFKTEIMQAEGELHPISDSPDFSKSLDLRQQLSIKTLRSEGLHLKPYQLKKLFLICLALFAFGIFFVIILTVLVTLMFTKM